METPPKKNVFLSNWDFFVWNWKKNILFGIGNGAEFRPQNRVIESPEYTIIDIFILTGTKLLVVLMSFGRK